MAQPHLPSYIRNMSYKNRLRMTGLVGVCHLPPYTKPLSVAQPKPPLAADLSQSCAANLSHA